MILDIDKTPFLYSMVTFLAYNIELQFYNDVHYVWCSDKYHNESQPAMSDPQTRGNIFLRAVKTGDRHSNAIKENIVGILRGARARYEDGTINKSEYKIIRERVNCASYEDFFPVLFIIKSAAVTTKCIEVASNNRASDNSVEYLITNLNQGEFEIITFKDLLNGIINASNHKLEIKK
jgi:hypothetical protein